MSITIADVDQVEAALAEAKASGDLARKQQAMDECARVRSAWRQQEEQAGRRSGIVATSED